MLNQNTFSSIQEDLKSKNPFSVVQFSSFKHSKNLTGSDIPCLDFEALVKLLKLNYQNQVSVSKDTALCYLFGTSRNNGRKKEDILTRSIIALDFDYIKPVQNIEELDILLNKYFEANNAFKYDYFIYSTTKHSLETPRLRVLIGLSSSLNNIDVKLEHAYSKLVTYIVHDCLQLKFSDDEYNKDNEEIIVDKGSREFWRLMIAPYKQENYSIFFKERFNRIFVNVNNFINLRDFVNDNSKKINKVDDSYIENLSLSRQYKLNLSTEEIKYYLDIYSLNNEDFFPRTPECKTSYDSWRDVLFAIALQYDRNEEGYNIALEWSLRDETRNEDHLKIQKATIETYYNARLTFSNSEPFTFASIIYRVNKVNRALLPEKIESNIKILNNECSLSDIEEILVDIAFLFYNDIPSNRAKIEDYFRRIKKKAPSFNLSQFETILESELAKLCDTELKFNANKIYKSTEKLPRGLFLYDKNFKKNPTATLENFKILLKSYGYDVKLNAVKREPEFFSVKDDIFYRETKRTATYSTIKSLLNFNNINLSVTELNDFALTLASENVYNPIIDFIKSKPWDGVSRLQKFFNTIKCSEDFSEALKEKLMEKWAISAVASQFETDNFTAKGVLVFQGKQSIGKTPWVRALLPLHFNNELFNNNYIKTGENLDPASVDDRWKMATYWIIELGELDATLKSREKNDELKAYINNNEDIFRRKFYTQPIVLKRSTVFVASVNPQQFLMDYTGNHRWWCLAVEKVYHEALADMDIQQFWAEIYHIYEGGKKEGKNLWYMSPDEFSELERSNEQFMTRLSLEDDLEDEFDLSPAGIKRSQNNDKCEDMTCSEIVNKLYPDLSSKPKDTSGLSRKISEKLQKIGVRRINKTKRYRMPLKDVDVD